MDFGRFELRALVPGMAGLSTPFAFGGLAVCCLLRVVRLGDIAGGWFGRVRRVLLGFGQFYFESRNSLFQFVKILLQPSTSLTLAGAFPCHHGEKL